MKKRKKVVEMVKLLDSWKYYDDFFHRNEVRIELKTEFKNKYNEITQSK